jgi:hypothetical protein
MKQTTKTIIILIFSFYTVGNLKGQIGYEQIALDYFLAKKDTFYLSNIKLRIKDSVSNIESVLLYFPNLNFKEEQITQIPYHNTILNIPKKYRLRKKDCTQLIWYFDKGIKYENNIYVLARFEKQKNSIGGQLVLFKLSANGVILNYYKSNWIE